MKNIFLKHILILAILNSSVTAHASQPEAEVAGETAANVESKISDDTRKRIADFITDYTVNAENSLQKETANVKIPDAHIFSEQLKAWEEQAKAGSPQNSAQLLEIQRGTPENREFQRRADKIVADIFKSIGGDSPAEYHAIMLELFTLYTTDPSSREPLEMLFTSIGNYHFTEDERKEIEKNKTFFGNMDKGILYSVIAGFGYFTLATPNHKRKIIKAFETPTAIKNIIKKFSSKLAQKKAINKKATVATGKNLLVVEPKILKDPSLNAGYVDIFRKEYRRDPRPNESIFPHKYDRNSQYNETVRIPHSFTRQTPARKSSVTGAVFTNINKFKNRMFGDLLKMPTGQATVLTAKFIGLSLIPTSIYATMARQYYNSSNKQFTVIPEDELTHFIRPLSILDLTCRIEQMRLEVKELQTNSQDENDQNIRNFKTLVEEYRFLLRSSSMYTNDVDEALPLPKGIKADKETGTITFTKNYEGEYHSISVLCPTRMGEETKTISLMETKKALEDVRDTLLSREISNDLQSPDMDSQTIAIKILEFAVPSHNQVVKDLMAQVSETSDTAALSVLNDLATAMKTLSLNSQAISATDLGARIAPPDEFLRKYSGSTSKNKKR